VTDFPAYGTTANPGDSLTVNLYLKETLTNGSVSLVFLDGGLFAGSLLVNRVSGDATLSDFIGGANGFIYPNEAPSPDGFGGKRPPPSNASLTPKVADSSPSTPTTAGIVQNADVPPIGTTNKQLGPQVAAPGTASSLFLLGTLNVIAGTTQSTFSVKNYSDTLGGFSISQLKTDFDSSGNGTAGQGNPLGYTYTGTRAAPLYTFTVGAAVPEPSSMALCGLIASGLSYAGYRRRKTSASEPATVA